MLETFAITAPIFMIIGIGFVTVRLGVFTKADARTLGMFVLYLPLPALIFKALSQSSLAEIVNVRYLLAYALGSATVLAGGIAVTRFARKKTLTASALYGLGMSCSNSGFVGYPVVLQLLGPPAAVALALNMLVENILVIPLAIALMESGSSRSGSPIAVLRMVFVRLFKNPLILAILAGTLVAVLEMPLPQPIVRAVDMLAMAAAPAALCAIGGMLVGLKVTGMVADVAQILGGKLILHPLAVLAAILLLPPFDPVLQLAAFAFACMPMMGIYPILGQRYGHGGVSAAALMAATAASFVTISIMLWSAGAAGLFAVPG